MEKKINFDIRKRQNLWKRQIIKMTKLREEAIVRRCKK